MYMTYKTCVYMYIIYIYLIHMLYIKIYICFYFFQNIDCIFFHISVPTDITLASVFIFSYLHNCNLSFL